MRETEKPADPKYIALPWRCGTHLGACPKQCHLEHNLSVIPCQTVMTYNNPAGKLEASSICSVQAKVVGDCDCIQSVFALFDRCLTIV